MRRLWCWWLVGGAAVFGLHALSGDRARDVLAALVGLGSALACVLGPRRRGSAAPLAWWCLGAGVALWASYDLLLELTGDALAGYRASGLLDVPYVAAYVPFTAGMLLLARARVRGSDGGGLLDAGVVTGALGLVSWVVLAEPVVGDTSATLLAHALEIAYPAADIVLVAVVVRMLAVPGDTSAALRLLAGAFALQLVADAVYVGAGTSMLAKSEALVLAYQTFYLLLGAAALHPSARARAVRRPAASVGLSKRRLVSLAAALVVAPAVLAVQLVVGTDVDGWPVVVASVVLPGLVLARLWVALHRVRAAMASRERLQGDLAHAAAHDSLTGLANRAATLEAVAGALHRARRSGDRVGLLFVDLDGFKAVNDVHGHRAGDAVLQEVARRLLAVVRAGDAVGRLGGDEFVVLVGPLCVEADVARIAARVLAALAPPVTLGGGREVVVGASIGVAVARDGGTDADALLHEADVAAYRAKEAGRGRVEVFDDALRRELAERAALEAEVRAGLAAGEFVLHYQPIVRLATGRVRAFEALVRWDRPGAGLVPPDRFIPVAEQSDLICELGRWVLGEATRQLAAWMAEEEPGQDGPAVTVNISPRHLVGPQVVADVVAALEATGVPAQRLVVEVTETVLVEHALVTAQLEELRRLGVRVSIDDFGTGYTSIAQMRHLPADHLKVDRSLVASDAPGAHELVQLVVSAAHAFGLTVCAEGVEHPEQVERLRAAGCDSAQGYLFARPQPAAALDAARRQLLAVP